MIISVSEGARSMIESSGVVATQTRYELRFANLFNRGRGYAFPCDAQGRVNIDELTNHARNNYLFARAVVLHRSIDDDVVVARAAHHAAEDVRRSRADVVLSES